MSIQSINIFKNGLGKSLGTLEAAIMEILWSADTAQSARQVTDALSQSDAVSFNAVSTVLNRLEKKGLVHKLASGKRYAFQAANTKEEYCYSVFSEGLQSLLGDKSLLSAAGITSGKSQKGIDPKTLQLLENFIQAHEQ